MPNVHMHEDWGSVDFLYWTKKASCQHKAPNSTSSRTPYSTVLTCKKSSSQQTSTSNHKSEQSKPAHHMIARLQEKEDLTNRSAKDSNPLWAILFGTCQDPWPKTALIHLPKSKKATPYGPDKHCHVHPLGPPTLGCMHIYAHEIQSYLHFARPSTISFLGRTERGLYELMELYQLS